MTVRKLSLICSWSLLLAASANADSTAADEEARLGKVRLLVGNEQIAPTAVISPWREFKQVGNRHFHVERERVVEVEPDHTTIITQISAPNGHDLAWLGNSGEIAYLAERRVQPDTSDAASAAGRRTWDEYPDPVVLRLDLKSMNWLPSLTIQEVPVMRDSPPRDVFGNAPEIKVRTFLGHILTHDGSVTLLTYDVTNEPPDSWQENFIAYQVTHFSDNSTKQAWALKFRAAGPYALRSGPLYQYRWRQSALTLLMRVANTDRLIVCAGPGEDLICLSAESGEVSWRISRLWEYEAGFIPHDYEPYVTRFGVRQGIERMAEGDSERRVDELSDDDWRALQKYLNLRSRFRREIDARIVAGPVFVPREGLFVGVERCRRSIDDSGEHPPEGIVYQIDDNSGMLDACARLPRELSEEIGPVADSEGTVWIFRFGAMARIRPDSDVILPIEWYRSRPTGSEPIEDFIGIPTAVDDGVFVRFGIGLSVELIDTMTGIGEPAKLIGALGAEAYARDVRLNGNRLTLAVESKRGTVGFEFEIAPMLARIRAHRPASAAHD